MTIPRTLLLTSTRPGDGSVFEIFLRDLCRLFPHDKLVCFAATSKYYEVGLPADDLDWIPMSVHSLPEESVGKPFAKTTSSTFKSLLHANELKRKLAPLIDEAVNFARQQKVELIWSTLTGPSLVHISRIVAERLRIPMISLICDPLDFVYESRGYDKFTRNLLLKEFTRTVELSRALGVASEQMKESYEQLYALPCEVLINSVDPTLRIDSGAELRNGDEFVIGFAGSIYAQDELQALIDTLGTIGWQIDGKDIRLRIFGNAINLHAYTAGKKCRFEFLGFHSTEEVIKEMSKSDVAYLPYWFDQKYSLAVRESFPNKFATYLAAGCPVLYHGPEDSSPIRFMKRYPVGIGCHTLDPQAIVQTLRRFVTDSSLRTAAAAARLQALDEELNPTVTRTRFARLIGVDQTLFNQHQQTLSSFDLSFRA